MERFAAKGRAAETCLLEVQCAVPLPFVVPSAFLGRRSCSSVCVPSGCCRRHIHPRLIKLCPWQPQEKDAQRLNCRKSFYRRVEISTKHGEWFYHPGSMQHPELGRAESMRRLKCRGRDIPVWLRRYLLRSPRYLTLAWPSTPPQVVDAIPSVLDGLVVHLFAVVSQRRGKESWQGIIVILWFH